MKRVKSILQIAAAALALTLSAAAPAAGGVPVPDVPAAVKGEQCVEDTDVMRRRHMDFLLDHRDATMHEGIRTKKHSLKECLACHVAPTTASATENEGHFCQNCHAYAGVRIDCFECHATRPSGSGEFHSLVTPNMKVRTNAGAPESATLLNSLARAYK